MPVGLRPDNDENMELEGTGDKYNTMELEELDWIGMNMQPGLVSIH